MDKTQENRGLNLSLADETYLRWYEITNALSHSHMDAIFCGLQQQILREIRRDGSGEISCATVIRCFRDVTQKMARSPALRRFESSVQFEDEAA